MLKQKRILICPLDWGLGHATRCIPIIRLLLEKNAIVIIAADGAPLALLKQEFPQLTFVQLKGYRIQYSKSGLMLFKMLSAIPRILKGIKNEHQELKKIVDENQINVVISDNRYGCWNKKAKSIFITHQLMIKTPFGEGFLHKKTAKYISHFDECWVPDLEGHDNLSGNLSHQYPLPKNTFYVGPLSRFPSASLRDHPSTIHRNHPSTAFRDHASNEGIQEAAPERSRRVMAIISGPEPQRSIFEKIILEQLKQSDLKALVVCGNMASAKKLETIKNITIVQHLNSTEMLAAIQQSNIIISRSGYSTIMDLAIIGKKAIFIPTPGQTEQEYLASYFMEKGVAFFQSQSSFNLQEALDESKNFKGFQGIKMNDKLKKRVDLILNS